MSTIRLGIAGMGAAGQAFADLRAVEQLHGQAPVEQALKHLPGDRRLA